ncbi:hypothetical protein RFI_21551 [Reticulomyxa filosa]|uniref:Uncharacterized protein n=1 Tax=Reticulomyxa filosa TaxID=46433 RepID=X6MQ91_RETFI|nr:hypothetical protein RFI_21551 [Reticulomyxa filosa]|eukprot:ETO15816.1 hypothetical protein RFI_21551 [Reticulomyxa filosa]
MLMIIVVYLFLQRNHAQKKKIGWFATQNTSKGEGEKLTQITIGDVDALQPTDTKTTGPSTTTAPVSRSLMSGMYGASLTGRKVATTNSVLSSNNTDESYVFFVCLFMLLYIHIIYVTYVYVYVYIYIFFFVSKKLKKRGKILYIKKQSDQKEVDVDTNTQRNTISTTTNQKTTVGSFTCFQLMGGRSTFVPKAVTASAIAHPRFAKTGSEQIPNSKTETVKAKNNKAEEEDNPDEDDEDQMKAVEEDIEQFALESDGENEESD